MIIGERLREIREKKNISQFELERKTGLVRYHLSRIENGHTIPSVPTLQKLATALEIPLYRLFYDEDNAPEIPQDVQRTKLNLENWNNDTKAARFWEQFRDLLSELREWDRSLLLSIAQKMAYKRK